MKLLILATGAGILSFAAPLAAQTVPVKHVIFFVRENHTFDNMFGTFPGANGVTVGKISTGWTVTLGEEPDSIPSDIDHEYEDSQLAVDGGKMDRFDLIPGAVVNGADYSMKQYYQRDIPNYWSYAQSYNLCDNMFTSMGGPSFPNHLYTVGAQTGGAFNNPYNAGGRWGCDDPSYATVQTLTTAGTVPQYPCFDFQTLPDLCRMRRLAGVTMLRPRIPPVMVGLRWMQSITSGTRLCGRTSSPRRNS